MEEICFVTAANSLFKKLAEGCMNSIRKFYPEAGIFFHDYHDLVGYADTGRSYNFSKDGGLSYDYLLPYFDRYKRVVCLNADYIMTNYCPELFGDFEYAMPYNNIDFYKDKQWPKFNGKEVVKRYVQNSLIVATNPEIYATLTKMNSKERAESNHPFYDMNTSNDLFYSGKYKTKALSFPDKSYGIEEMHMYHEATLRGKDIYVGDKLLCMIHFSGNNWKSYETGEPSWDLIIRPEVKERIKELMA